MFRNFIVGAFEAFAYAFFVGIIAYGTWYGWTQAEYGMIWVGLQPVQPWQGAIAGFVGGTVAAIVATGLIFTLLDIRAGTDRLAWLVERELDRRYGDDD